MEATPFPPLMLITQRARMKPDFEAALHAVLRAAEGAAPLVQLREGDLPHNELLHLAQRAREICELHGVRLLVNDSAEIARASGAFGVHWPERALPFIGAEGWGVCGVSVHSVEAARRAQASGAHYLIFGHVWETDSHPGASGRGLATLHEVCGAVSLPVYAVGGVTAGNARLCLEAGARGVAVIGAAWDVGDVGDGVRDLLRALA